MLDDFILHVCNFLDKFLNPIIVLLMLLEIVLFIVTEYKMINICREVNKLNKPLTKNKVTNRLGSKMFQRNKEINSNISWDDFEECIKQYQREWKYYSWFSLSIQLFTLLGILGTVAGLYIALKNGALNGDNLYEGVGLALSSTVLGILLAVVFKSLDILFLSKLINDIDGGIELFEKSYKAMNDDVIHQTLAANKNDFQED